MIRTTPCWMLLWLIATTPGCSEPTSRPDSTSPRPKAGERSTPARRAAPAEPRRREAPLKFFRRRPAPTLRPQARPTRPAVAVPTAQEAAKRYPWPRRRQGYESLATRFPAPAGFTRVVVKPGSYADWLRHLPLLPRGTPVRDYAGGKLSGATAAAMAVVDLDVGKKDLQQCMDTLMRLRGEYFWWRNQAHKTRFRYAGGKYFGWAQWSRGIRPRRKGRRIVYVPRGRTSYARQNFRRYLTFMFMMTGTIHNTREPRVAYKDLAAGHFFVQPPPSPGSLGHAVVLLDLARNSAGKIRALIGEGYTPAQDFHVLKAAPGKAWYTLDPTQGVQTPQWPTPFTWKQLHRFRY